MASPFSPHPYLPCQIPLLTLSDHVRRPVRPSSSIDPSTSGIYVSLQSSGKGLPRQSRKPVWHAESKKGNRTCSLRKSPPCRVCSYLCWSRSRKLCVATPEGFDRSYVLGKRFH